MNMIVLEGPKPTWVRNDVLQRLSSWIF